MRRIVTRFGGLLAAGILAAAASCGGATLSTADGGAEDATVDGPPMDDAQDGATLDAQDDTDASIGAPDAGVDVSTMVDGDASAADVSLDAWDATEESVGAPDAGADSTIVDADASTADVSAPSDAPSGDALDEPDVAEACAPFPSPPNNVVSYQCGSSTGQVSIPFQYPLCDGTGDALGGTTPTACQTCETFTCDCLLFEAKTQGTKLCTSGSMWLCADTNGVPYVICK